MTSFAKSAAIICLMAGSSAFAQVPDWSVSETSGAVTVVRARGDAVKATRGMAVKHGDAILTGPKSRAVMVRKSEFITVSPNSRITVAPPKAGSMVQIVQKSGTAVYKIQKKTTPHFAVETPYLAAVVKGTTFSVNVDATGAAVQVTEGRVQVVSNQGSAEYLLTPGKIGLVDAKSPDRLNVQGDGKDVIIDSAGQASEAPAASVDATTDEPKIAADVTEGSVHLDRLTDGLIAGDASLKSIAMLDGAYDEPVEDQDDGRGGGDDDAGVGGAGNGDGAGVGESDNDDSGNDNGGAGNDGSGTGGDDGGAGGGNDDGSDDGNPVIGDDDGNNGNGNDDDGDDDSNPGNGGGSGNGDTDGGGNDDDGNNGNGNDDDGDDGSNPGNGSGNGGGNGNGNRGGNGNDDR